MPIQIIIEVENYDELPQAFAAFGYARSDVLRQSSGAVPDLIAAQPEKASYVQAPDPGKEKPVVMEKPKPKRKRRTKAEMEAARAGNGQDKAAPEPKPEPARPAPAPEGEAMPSLDDIRALVQKLAPTHLQECADVLAEFGVTKSSDLDPQHYDAVHTKLSALQS